MDFIEISNIMFINKHKYNLINDNDKINAFYMINKKLSLGTIKNKPLYTICQSLNNKFIQRDSAIDLWYLYFKKLTKQEDMPSFWWIKNPNKKDKEKSVSKSNKELIMNYYDLSEKDFEFLYKYYKDDVDYKIKILNR